MTARRSEASTAGPALAGVWWTLANGGAGWLIKKKWLRMTKPETSPHAGPTAASSGQKSLADPAAVDSGVRARLPLDGVRGVEFTHMVMGPTCGMVLADLGAEVIKVEPLAGDSTRRLLGSGAGFFALFNRNKKPGR